MKGFDSFTYFRYLSKGKSELTSSDLKNLLETFMSYNSIRLEEVDNIMGTATWTFSDFLRFLYSSHDQLSRLLLSSFKVRGPTYSTLKHGQIDRLMVAVLVKE